MDFALQLGGKGVEPQESSKSLGSAFAANNAVA